MTEQNFRRNPALDAFRGLAIIVMILVDSLPDWEKSPPFLLHTTWEGISLADTAFPAFLFAMGGAAAFSRRQNILGRVFFLFVLGLAFNAFPSLLAYCFTPDYNGENFLADAVFSGRLPGVLQRLALAYLLGCLLIRLLKTPGRLALGALFLLALSSLGYHLYAPANPFDPEDNVSHAVDMIFPGAAHIYQPYGIPTDPEGFYGVFSATASFLWGFLAGEGLKKGLSLKGMTAGGLLLLLGGIVWSLTDIVSKPLWTAPFALLNAGGDTLCLTALALLFRWQGKLKDQLRTLLKPLRAFGQNPLFFYLITNISLMVLANLPAAAGDYAYHWLWQKSGISPALFSGLWCLLWWPLAEWLYRRGIVIKI